MSRIKRPTLKTVAQTADVSLPTVSQVMRGVGRISVATRKKVLAAADLVGYVPDQGASLVRTGRSNEVVIIVHDIQNSFNAELIQGVSLKLEKEGYFLSIMDAHGEPARLEKLVRIAISKNCAGLLWVPSERVDRSLPHLIEKQHLPNVTFLRGISGSTAPSIRIANEAAIIEAAQYLHELGHSKIAFAGGIGTNQTRLQRMRGYEMGMKKITGSKPIILDFEDTKEGGFRCAMKFINEKTDATAVICNGDEFAIGLCLGLQRLGLQPGEDVSVIGFDDIAEARMLTPALTTMSVSPTVFGERLANVMLSAISGNLDQVSEIFVSATLIKRETTGRLNAR